MGIRRDDESLRRDGDQLRREGGDFIDETDVEGHLRSARNLPDSESEGLYRNLPTTQGEVIRRSPGDNPHGDR